LGGASFAGRLGGEVLVCSPPLLLHPQMPSAPAANVARNRKRRTLEIGP
jgi:hypothetical protein